MDLFVKPISGAEENGLVGFGTGLMKGVGNAMFKPTAGEYTPAGLGHNNNTDVRARCMWAHRLFIRRNIQVHPKYQCH